MGTNRRPIHITENQLKNIILESVKKALGEAIEMARNVPQQIRNSYLKKMIKEYPDLDPDGFFWMGDSLKHNGKKKPKNAPKEKIGKPEGMRRL